MAKQNFTFMSRNPPPEPEPEDIDLDPELRPPNSLRDWEFARDGSMIPIDASVVISEDVDRFTEELGPIEIKDLPCFAAVMGQNGGTGLREFAANSVSVDGNWAEFGASMGLSGWYWTHCMPEDKQLFLFDSWEGLPEQWIMRRVGDKIGGLPKGAFGDVNMPVFHDERVVMVPGWFEDTLPKEDMGTLAFVHVDCDLYSSTKTVLAKCNEQIVPGTVILFDELWGYQCWREGEYKALMEWDREWRYIGRDNHNRVAIEVL